MMNERPAMEEEGYPSPFTPAEKYRRALLRVPAWCFCLFSVVLFFLYLLPVAELPASSVGGEFFRRIGYGSVYGLAMSFSIPALGVVAVLFLVVGALMFAMAVPLYIALFDHRDEKLIPPLTIFEACMCIALSVLSAAVYGICAKEGAYGDVVAGAAPAAVLALSLLLLIAGGVELALVVMLQCRDKGKEVSVYAATDDPVYGKMERPVPPEVPAEDDKTSRRAYKKACTVYRYRAMKYEQGALYIKSEPSYPHMWARLRHGAITAAVAAVAVLLTLSLSLASSGPVTRKNAKKIALGTESAAVLDILGTPLVLNSEDSVAMMYVDGRNVASAYRLLYENAILNELNDAQNTAAGLDLTERCLKHGEARQGKAYALVVIEYEAVRQESASEEDETGGEVQSSVKYAVTSVRYERGIAGQTAEKSFRSVELGRTSMAVGEKARIPYTAYFADGSFLRAYLPESALSSFTAPGEYTLQWSDGWGSYEAPFTVTAE